MKREFVIIAAMLLVSVLVGCGENKLELENNNIVSMEYEPADNDIVSTEYATMFVESRPDMLNESAITLIIKNVSDIELDYDEIVYLNILENNIWYDIPNQITDYIEVSYGLSPGQEATYTLQLDSHFGELTAGHYRVIKPVYGVGTENVVVAEFDKN